MAQRWKITSVKDFLATGLLEGQPVTYKHDKQKKNLKGFIKGDGYVCDCSSCDYNGEVLSALQFEKHANATSHNQNNHIFLDNGKSLYEVFHHLKTVPATSLYDEIERVTGVATKMKQGNDQQSPVASSQASNDKMYSLKNYSPTESEAAGGIGESDVREIDKIAGEQPRNNSFHHAPLNVLRPIRKYSPEEELKDVRGLLATGLLDGCRVTYKKSGVKTPGIIQDQGYLCGCSDCKYSKVLTAYDFEKHSGVTSSNQTDHIFFDNEMTLYKLVKGLKGTTLHLLADVIEEKIGCLPNLYRFDNWKASCRLDTADPDAMIYSNTPQEVHSEPFSIPSSQESVTKGTAGPAVATVPMNSLAKPASHDIRHLDWKVHAKCRSQRKVTHPEEGTAHPALHADTKNNSEKTSSDCTVDPDCSSRTKPKSPGPVTRINTDSITASDLSTSFASSISLAERTDEPSSNHSVQKCSMMKNMPEPKARLSSSPESAASTVKGSTNDVSAKRDTSLHQLVFKEDGLPDGTALTYRSKGEVLITGHKRGNCIVCACHNEEFSPSQFEAHAGMGRKRQPYRSIYTSDGMTLHELSVKLRHGLKLSKTHGGNACPRPTHSGVDSSTVVPSANPRLKRALQGQVCETERCHVCRSGETTLRRLDENSIFYCCQCERACHAGCSNSGRTVPKTPHRILQECRQKEFFCSEECCSLRASLDEMMRRGKQVVPAGERLTNDGEADVRWELIKGRNCKNPNLLCQLIQVFQDAFEFSRMAKKDEEDLIPKMVYAREVDAELDFQGMYCAVITVNSVVVSAAMLKVPRKNGAELAFVATRREWQRKGYYQTLLKLIETQLSLWGVTLLMAPVDVATRSIWKDKFGYTIAQEGQKKALLQLHPILMFENASLVWKNITPQCDVKAERCVA